MKIVREGSLLLLVLLNNKKKERKFSSYHFHRKNNFDNVIDYFVRVHRYLQVMMIMGYYKQSNENIQYDNIIQVIQ
jgi:hypothetical protein